MTEKLYINYVHANNRFYGVYAAVLILNQYWNLQKQKKNCLVISSPVGYIVIMTVFQTL